MLRRKRILILAVASTLLIAGIMVAALSSTSFRKWYRPPIAELPCADDVAEMRASLLESPLGLPRTPEFVVPAEHVAGVLYWLRPGEYVSQPPIFPQDELGEIWIKTKSGREFR